MNFMWRQNNQNTQAWEQMELIQTADNKIIIQCRWNGRKIYKFKSLDCNQEIWEKFDVESDKDGKLNFISCQTGNLRSNVGLS